MNFRTHSAEMAERRAEVDRITAHAAKAGLAVTADFVSDNLPWFRRWYMGLIATGHLMNRTGVKYKPRVTVTRKVGYVTDGTTMMVDTIHADVTKVPANVPEIAGYISGTSDIDWTSADWARFTKARKVRVYQGYGPVPAPHAYDAVDIESGAVTPAQAAQCVKQRVDAGIPWTTFYATDGNAALANAEVQKLGEHYWNGHVNIWLADWNLSQETAIPYIGRAVHGATCIGVQWASPSSNPHTLLPGTSLTLAQANVDLSIVDNTWIPSGGWGTPPAPPAPPAPAVIRGIIVQLSSGAVGAVQSTDGGKTWH